MNVSGCKELDKFMKYSFLWVALWGIVCFETGVKEAKNGLKRLIQIVPALWS